MIKNRDLFPPARRIGRWVALLLMAAVLGGLTAGCGDPDPYGARGVPYRSERYSSQNGPYRMTGGSEDTWGPFSNGRSEYQNYDDGQGNGMTYSRSRNSSQFP